MPQEGIREYISTYEETLEFTPNNAVNSVAMTLVGHPGLANTPTNLWFQNGDIVLIEGMYLAIPYQWSAAELGPIQVQFGWLDDGGAFGTLEFFSGSALGNIPQVENYFEIGTKIETPAGVGAGAAWLIRIDQLNGLNINMINSPASLNDIDQQCRMNLKVVHTLTMIP